MNCTGIFGQSFHFFLTLTKTILITYKPESHPSLSAPLTASFAPETNHSQTRDFFLINQCLLNDTTYFLSIFLTLLVAVSQSNASYIVSEICICSLHSI